MRYKIVIAYDGTDFSGWQRQPKKRTVQQTLEEGFEKAVGLQLKITASGRTDAGVHAAAQVCHFDAEGLSVPAEKLPNCVNRFLPADVKVISGEVAADDFDATRGAKRKTYRYSLYESEQDLPLKERYALKIEGLPSLEELQTAAKLFEGEKDFKAFCASGSAVKTTVRTVYSVEVKESRSYGGRDVDIFVTGNGFLYNMVRTIVGTILDVCAGRKTKEDLSRAFETGDRRCVGKTVAAKGLTLYSVCYHANAAENE